MSRIGTVGLLLGCRRGGLQEALMVEDLFGKRVVHDIVGVGMSDFAEAVANMRIGLMEGGRIVLEVEEAERSSVVVADVARVAGI